MKRIKKLEKYRVVHFDDYHDIEPYAENHGYNNFHELGCFPAKGYGYTRYYGLFWNGKIPSKKSINEKMKVFLVKKIIHRKTSETIEFHASEISYPTKQDKPVKEIKSISNAIDKEVISELLKVLVSDYDLEAKIGKKIQSNTNGKISVDDFGFWLLANKNL